MYLQHGRDGNATGQQTIEEDSSEGIREILWPIIQK